MNERYRQSIVDHLRDKEVQDRIQSLIERSRNEATVTISQAGQIFDLSENRLRDWEDIGLLQPERPSGARGRRLYTLLELDKLAIIKELIDAKFSPSDIPHDIYDLWTELTHQLHLVHEQGQTMVPIDAESIVQELTEPIDTFVERVYRDQLFYRYFASHILHLLLVTLRAELPDNRIGILLPRHTSSSPVTDIYQIEKLGESLVGWLGYSRTFYAFLTNSPNFEFPSDYQICPLHALSREDTPFDASDRVAQTHFIFERKALLPHLSSTTIEVIHRLLKLLYENAEQWNHFFGYGRRDNFDPLTNFARSKIFQDVILDNFVKKIVHLGQETVSAVFKETAEYNPWKFCCLLLPRDTSLPLPQQSLVVRAKSKRCPHRLGSVSVSPHDPTLALSLRAFQSGNVVYRHIISDEDLAIAARDEEGADVRSAIALPVGSENGTPVAVIYIAATTTDAFSAIDVTVLRYMARLIEELLHTYTARFQATDYISEIINYPFSLDASFRDFSSEKDFIEDVEKLLQEVWDHHERVTSHTIEVVDEQGQASSTFENQVVSFLSINIDNQSMLANMYGDRTIRNLTRLIGQHIQGQFSSIFRKRDEWQLYYIYGDRFYVMLKNVSVDRARDEAEKLRVVIEGPQYVDALRSVRDRPTMRYEQMRLDKVTIRLAVSEYLYSKLDEILGRYDEDTRIADVRAVMMRSLDESLRLPNMNNSVAYWNSKERRYVRWSPPEKA
jgi:DNA-binding transcriptional MerR regulator/GGDEF domain-containing protein